MLQQDAGIVKRAITGILSRFDYEKRELDQRWLKELRLVVRKNEQVVPSFVDRLFEELHKEDCDRRLGVLLIADYFFQRSHGFRNELVDHIQDFTLYTIESDPLRFPLPGPPNAARTLKKEALFVLNAWIKKFEQGYTKLKTAAIYLRECKHFDFAEANAQLQAERQRAEEAQKREEEKAKKIGEKVRQNLAEARNEIERTLTECQMSIKLLFPNVYAPDDSTNEPSTAAESGDQIEKLHGYKADDKLTIVIDTASIRLEETSHNSDLISALRDTQVLLARHQKTLSKWLTKLTGAAALEENAALIRELIDCKARVAHELQRSKQLEFQRARSTIGGSSASESDGEFEDVIKEGLELEWHDPRDEDDEDAARVLQRIDQMERDERALAASCNEPTAGPSGWTPAQSSSAVDAGEVAVAAAKVPKLQFGLDLKYWGQNVEAAVRPRNEFEARAYWSALDPCDDVISAGDEVYKTRQMTFVSERPLIKHKCRAPLRSGKLCERMDMAVCPFHGPVVDRDTMGYPVEELGQNSLIALNNAETRIRKNLEADEREYIKDVEKAVGVPLQAIDRRATQKPVKNKAHGTARKREKSQSIQIRERLKTKLFNRNALKRVTDTLNTLQQERASKNFANQFNYALTRR